MTDAQVAQLLAMLERLTHGVETLLALFAPEAPSDAPCAHPLEERDDCSTMGEPRFRCSLCGAIVEGTAGSERRAP